MMVTDCAPLHMAVLLAQKKVDARSLMHSAFLAATPPLVPSLQVVRALVENGASLDVSSSGGTPIKVALSYGKNEMAEVLCEMSPEVYEQGHASSLRRSLFTEHSCG